MTDKIREIKKAVLRLMLALAIGVLAGAAPGAVLVSHAETETVAAAADPASAETASEDDGTTFLLSFFGGIILLILFGVVIVIATATSTAGVVGAQEDE